MGMKIIRKPERILIVRSGAIGDVLMSTPLLRCLRQSFPRAKISYLVGKWAAPVLKNNPNIDEIIAFDQDIIINKRPLKTMALANAIRKRRFNLCIILDKSWLWSAFIKMAGIPISIGFSREKNRMKKLNTISVPFNAKKYELDYYLDIAKRLGLSVRSKHMELFPSREDLVKVNKVIKHFKLPMRNMVGMAPGGAENPGQRLVAKRWPLKSYRELARRLVDKGFTVLLFGSKNDKRICDEISKASPKIISLAGITNIQQSYVLMKRCRFFVTHDSGPMHIAAAAGFGRKLITIFGPTSPKRFAPKDSIVLKPKMLPRNYNVEQDVYKPIPQSSIRYARVDEVIRLIR